MKIQAKLAVLIGVTVAVCVAASGVAFVSLQKRALLRAEAEKESLLFDGVRKVASESLLAQDPLMLLSYLAAMRRDRPEVRACRVKIDDQWQTIGTPKKDPQSSTHLIQARWPGPPPRLAEVEIDLSHAALVDRERRDFRAMLSDVLRIGLVIIVAGLVVSYPLSATLSHRLLRIEAALDEIGRGRFAVLADTRGSDEISRLGRNVNSMSRRLRELEEMKKLLVASVSHELRSPLAAIESTIRRLLDQPNSLDDRTRSGLQSIRQSAVRLEHFVSSMLEMAKIERGKLEFNPRPSRIAAVVEDAVSFFDAKARDAGLSIAANVLADIPAFAFDPDLISQVMTNLISNAVKFTPSGGRITITVREDSDAAVVRVEDTGVGMPAEALQRIFTPFERVPNEMRATGTGLGLAISKAAVERHGGRLSVESAVGQGSAFSFSLPFSRAS